MMNKFFESHHPVRRAKSFQYAFRGVYHALLNEANFRIQVVIVILAIILGIYFKISNTEWSILALSMGFLLSAELLNTAVEEFLDNLLPEEHEGIKVIKDVTAGFVLITAITALFILILIFGHRIFNFFV